MKRKFFLVVSMMLCVVLALSPLSSAHSNQHNSKYNGQYKKLKDRGAIHKDPKHDFRPNDSLTYAEAAKMMVKAFDLSLAHVRVAKEPKASDFYTKVGDNKWYSEFFIISYHNGLEFAKDVNPNAKISKEEFANHVYNMIEKKGPYAYIEIYIEVKDNDKINKNYQEAVQKLLITKIASLDKNQKFNPKSSMNRGEAADWLEGAIEFIESTKPVQPEPEEPDNDDTFLQDAKVVVSAINKQVNEVKISVNVPHPGYNVELKSITFKGKKAYLDLELIPPTGDRMYPQVITERTITTYVDLQYSIVLE